MAANRSGRSSAPSALIRLFSIVDEPDEDDDARLRKRIGVVAGYATIFAPLTIPLQATGLPIAWPVAVALSGFSVGNLLVLARTRRFDRYVVALLTIGVVFVPVANVLGGGVTGATMGLVWAFMASAYAILALGPARATPWFFAFVVSFAGMLAIDPLVVSVVPAPPYLVRLASYVPNIALPLTITFLLFRYTDVRRREAEARTDELLTNAIPAPIAARLRRGEQRIAESYPETTVLFADIVGFTPWAQRTDPDRVVALLDALFSRFDELAARDGVEKIKTIGDAYMAVAGAPERRDDHAAAALRLARDILDAVAVWRSQHHVALEVRIGLASGRVVAGVIGSRRILFDLWGDTVNTAARMESSGLPGRIQVAPSTRERLRDVGVAFDERTVDVKGLGEMRTYVVRDGS
ncbi:MAG: adenylate/guanylate cyclase domain-containing protein [Chloroflexota bacterium]